MEFKVLTYNIMHGLDYKKLLNKERIIDLDKICEIIKKSNPDIIGLNEVYNDIEEKISVPQAQYIASKLGYQYYYFGKAITIHETIEYGNAIISKYPIKNIKKHMIEDPKIKDEDVYYETRNIIECEIEINDVSYKTFVTHIGLAKSEQKNGIDKLKSLIKDEKVFIMGDFNMEEDNENIISLSKLVDNTSYLIDDSIKGNKLTYPSINPKIKIDYIFTKNINVKQVQVIKEVGSDHYPVEIVVEI